MSLLTALSIPCAILPALGFLWLMWWLDRYDREPWWLFGSAFLWGSLPAAGLVYLATRLPFPTVPGIDAGALLLIEGALLAPLLEEPAKAAILPFIARSRHFDNTTDGFVYGAAAGIGFAMSENLLYFVAAARSGESATWLGLVTTRTLYCALMHASASSVVGAALGWAKAKAPAARLQALVLGLCGALVIHGVWNGLLVAGTVFSGGFSLLDLLIFPVEFVVLFGIFQACLLDEARILREGLAEEARAGVLPEEYAVRLSSWAQRNRKGWLPPEIDHRRLVQVATTLAFRKERAGGRVADPELDLEIEGLRDELRRILKT